MRNAKISRKTLETSIEFALNLDGQGKYTGTCGIGFFDHMLTLFCGHSGIDIHLQSQGDLEVDTHHLIEDLGIVMGQAIFDALGDKVGIRRYGNFFCPMDETLTQVTLDFSGRPFLVANYKLSREYLGDFECEMLKEFLLALSMNAKMNLHINVFYGENNHHIVESIFKAMGHAFNEAIEITGTGLLSTKGAL